MTEYTETHVDALTGHDGEAGEFEAAASFAQQRLWFLDQLEPGSPVYNINMALRLRGNLDSSALQTAVNQLVARHETLRTSFDAVDEETIQVIAETPPRLSVNQLDCAATDEQATLRALGTEPFDLARGPLLRVHLLRRDADEHVLLLVIHHIIADAWLLDVLYRELATLYGIACEGREPVLPELPVQYADYAEWQQEWLSGEQLDKQLRYWGEHLADAPELLELPLDRPRPRIQSHAGATLEQRVDAQLADALKQLAQQAGCTQFILYLAAFATLLSRWAATDDVVIGTPIAGRQRTELEGLIGFFVNTLGIRIDLQDDPSFTDLLAATKRVSLGAFAHQDLPFEKLVEELQPERSTSHSPLFQVMFVQHHAAGQGMPFADLQAETIVLDTGTAKFDLTLFVTELQEGVSALFEYNTDLFDAATIERMLGHFTLLLQSIAEDPDCPVSQLPLLGNQERDQILNEFNRSQFETQPFTVHELVEQQAERTPTDDALSFGEITLSYSELNARANSLAAELQTRGAGPGRLVGICAERSIDSVVAVLAVLKAGAAYVPIDPHYPADRIAAMLADSQAALLVTQSPLADKLPADCARVLLDDCDGLPGDRAAPNRGVTGYDEGSAYVIYTSGSTGKPKGVELTQRNLSNLVQWQIAQPGLDKAARTLQFASLSFDVSFQELFTTWAQGGCVVLVDEETRRDMPALAAYIRDQQIERLYLPFAALQPLADAVAAGNAADYRLQDVIVAGEQLQVTPTVRAMFSKLTDARLHNHYGPSETHVTTAFTLAGDPAGWMPLPPIGTPVANTRAYVLDNNREPVPVGIPGELYLAGAQVARGYLHRPELTNERFLPDPYSRHADERLYRTGDRVRFLPDGNLEYLGRTDDQVKWRGFRIEPGEIETILAGHTDVAQAAVMLREDNPGDKRLVAYMTGDADPDELRTYLKTRLPEYMVPSVIVVLDELPLTPSGKLARRSLPVPDYADFAQKYVAPRNPTEEQLTGIWADVLGVDDVGVHDDFFALGGHSLLATQLISRVRDATGQDVALMSLFERPSVGEFAALLDDQTAASDDHIPSRTASAPVPLSFAQQRLWFLDQLEPGNPAYNFPVAVELTGSIDEAALLTALRQLTERHETLRTVFNGAGSDAHQVVQDEAVISIDRHDDALPLEALLEKLTELSQQPFDLSAGPLLRVHLVNTDQPDKHILLLVMHHIVSDGWSLGIVLSELAAGYRAATAGQTAELPPLPIHYADFAAWQRDWLSEPALDAQLSYWKQQLADMPPALDLPTDRPRPAEQTFTGGSEVRWLDPTLQTRLQRVAGDEGCTLFMLLLAAFDVLLATHAATTEVVVGTPIAGRQRTELEGLIGFLSNTLAIPARLDGDPEFTTFVRSVRETLLGAYEHQDLPFEKLVEELQPERAMSHSPLFQVMFVFQNNPEGDTDFGPLQARTVGFEMGIAKFDLLLEMAETSDGLRTGLQYNTDLFDAGTISRMLDHLATLLEGIAANPARPVSEIPLLDDAERTRVITDINRTDFATQSLSVTALVERQAAATPHATALRDGDTRLSYAELNGRANSLAGALQAAGAGPGTRVGICAERSITTAIGVLAALKSGAAYVPVDPNYPADRVATMLSDSQAVALLTDSAIAKDLPAHDADTILLDQFDWQSSTANPDNDHYADGSVYVIYTSGSTGKPKGVELTHTNLSNLLQWQNAQPGLDKAATTLQFASLSFDVSFQELFTTWAQGGCVVLVDEETRRDMPALARFIRDAQIERVYLPFAALQPLAEAVADSDGNAYRISDVIVAGEQLQVTPAVRAMFAQLGNARLHNHYGPSETHVTTAYTMAGNPDAWPALPPIGKPVANTQVYVLNSSREPLPVGVPGELYLAGAQVAKGYLHRHELTAEKFLPDPWSNNDGRLYRTGDRVRLLADGNLEYLGRTDDQVKWRGFRIEPGEIETMLTRYDGIRQAAVVLREDRPGDKRLVAYVVPGETAPDTGSLRVYLREHLPEFMVPSVIMELDALPLTPSGKLARRALPVPDYGDAAGTAIAPRNATEEQLVGLWQEVLGLDDAGIQHDFFALGGHSLLATQLTTRVRETLGVDLPLKYVFRNPTPELLAAAIEALQMAGELQDATEAEDDEDREEFEL